VVVTRTSSRTLPQYCSTSTPRSCIAYRGVLLALLVGALGKPLSIAGIRIGWRALPVVAFFGLAHGLTQALSTDTISSIVASTVMGAGFVWLKERTSSIWVTVIVHNLANNGSSFFNALPKAA
jgi:hypothetical protein